MPDKTPRPASASVDPADVDRFNRLGDLWWDENGKMGILHEINPIRVDYVRDLAVRYLHRDRHAVQPFAGLTLADIGCGGGILAEALADLGAGVTGIDPAPNNIEVAQASRPKVRTRHRLSQCHRRGAGGQRRDIRYRDRAGGYRARRGTEGFVGTLSRLVKPGGLLFLATIDRTLKSYALAIIGAEYVLRWVPRGTHSHDKFVRPDELAGWLRLAELREIDRAGMSFQPLTRSWRKSGDTDVNYLMAAKKDG